MFIVYALLIHLAFLLLLPMLLLHPRLRDGFWARLGFMPEGWPDISDGPVVWFHGASAGDLLAIEPVIAQLKQICPDCRVVLTTITSSGDALIKRGIAGVDASAYLPYDLPFAVKRMVRRIKPQVLVLEYAEVWPALVRSASRYGSRIMITNGRFDERALGKYRLLYRLIGNPLVRIHRLCMREQAEAEHALAIGARPDQIEVTGNTKFDRVADVGSEEQPPAALADLARLCGISSGQLVWVAGSTHEGEEDVLFEVFQRLLGLFPQLRLLIAPRYPERASRVLALAEARGLSVARRSAQVSDEAVVVWDTVGELSLVYALATVVFVGGSFVSRGGQNILEPAARGKPVLFGPHMENFRDSVQVLIGRGGIQVSNSDKLFLTLSELLREPEEADKLGALAKDAVGSAQGASEANARVILELLGRARGEDAR